jgi:hypothetical protein
MPFVPCLPAALRGVILRMRIRGLERFRAAGALAGAGVPLGAFGHTGKVCIAAPEVKTPFVTRLPTGLTWPGQPLSSFCMSAIQPLPENETPAQHARNCLMLLGGLARIIHTVPLSVPEADALLAAIERRAWRIVHQLEQT